MSRRPVLGWMMFDWASQPFYTLLLTFVFAPYFVQAVVGDPAQGQAVWGYMMAASGVVIAVLSPVLGAIADSTGPRKPWVAGFSVLYVAGAAALWWAAPGMPAPALILLAFAIGLIGAEFATTFTNAMLPDLGSRDEIGRISGSGWALGYVGGLVALALTLGLLAESPEGRTLLGHPPALGLDPAMREGTRAAGPLTALWYVLFMIPFFLWVPDMPRRARAAGAVRAGLAGLAATLRGLPDRPGLLAFLGASMLYRDALNGLFAFGAIYAAGVMGWSVVQTGIFGIVAALVGALGAWAGGRADSRFGPRPVIVLSTVLLTLACVAVVLTTPGQVMGVAVAAGSGLPDLAFYACGALIGAAGGSLQAASRTLLVHQADPARMTEAFGLYALAGKATAFLAPLSIAVLTDLTGSQRLGITPIIVLFLGGLVLLAWVRSDPEAAHAR